MLADKLPQLILQVAVGVDAEDITQEVFVRLLDNRCARLKSFSQRSSLSSWLRVVAINAARDYARKSRRLRELYPDREPLDPRDDGEKELQLRFLQSVIEGFSPEDEMLFELRYGEGFSFKEIGRILGKSPGSPQVRMSRLKGRIRREAERAGIQ
jgi:RNA polymerase sigma-70 factor (ECF subfamily)